MEFFKKEIKTSTGLIAIFAAAVLFVGGALTYWYYNDPNSYDTSTDATVVATTTNSNTNTASETADWKTYTNSDYGFNFKYPNTWNATNYSTKSAALFSQTNVKKDASGVVQPNIIIGYNSLTDFVHNEFGMSASYSSLLEALQSSTSYLKSENIDTHKLTIGGETGYWAYVKDAVTVYIQKDNLIYTVTFWSTDRDYDSIPQEQKNILTSLQFTIFTADWKIFTNTAYDYSIKYPTGWSPTSIGDVIRESGVSIANNTVNYGLGVNIVQSQLSLDNYITSLKTEAANYIKNGQPGDTFGMESQITIGGQPATKIINCTEGASAYNYDLYFVKKDSNMYKISITKVVGEGTAFDATSYIKIAEAMISTFQFTK